LKILKLQIITCAKVCTKVCAKVCVKVCAIVCTKVCAKVWFLVWLFFNSFTNEHKDFHIKCHKDVHKDFHHYFKNKSGILFRILFQSGKARVRLKKWFSSSSFFTFYLKIVPVKKACFTGILTGPRGQLGPNEVKWSCEFGSRLNFPRIFIIFHICLYFLIIFWKKPFFAFFHFFLKCR